jgi:hypothetical protein
MKARKMRKQNPATAKNTKKPHVKYMISLVLTTVQKVSRMVPINPSKANPKITP